MTKKKLAPEVFVLLDGSNTLVGVSYTPDAAKRAADDEPDMDIGMILKVVQAWNLEAPDEPKLEMTDLSLDSIN